MLRPFQVSVLWGTAAASGIQSPHDANESGVDLEILASYDMFSRAITGRQLGRIWLNLLDDVQLFQDS